MKPFLILQLRPNDQASDGDFQAFLKASGLKESEVHRIRMEKTGIPENIVLEEFSGVIVGGGPDNISDDEDKKRDVQKSFEKQLYKLIDEIVKKDFPFMGACYGFGALAHHQEGIVNKTNYSEPPGAVTIRLRDSAGNDDLLKELPTKFRAFVGHKESCQELPARATWLASSQDCPHHIFRLKKNIYATQFHPELDAEGICLRIEIYKNAGYFPPEDAEKLKAECRKEDVTVPMQILKNFADKYRSQ